MRQYAFQPQEIDPMQSAQMQWEDMRNELNIVRDQLEHSDADRSSQASLIDMLRGELAASKSAHERDQVLLIALRTKLKSAGLLLIDALREDTVPHDEPKPEFVFSQISPALSQVPTVDVDEDDSAREVVRGIRDIANKWP